MQEFNEGDLVEAAKGETVIRGRVGDVYVGDSSRSIAGLFKDGFTFATIEKAAPKLPSEPGLYEDTEGDVWMQNLNHDWSCLTSGHRPNVSMPVTESIAAAYAPFTRLEPVPVTAKKVLDELRGRIGSIDSAYDFQAVAAEFGVTE